MQTMVEEEIQVAEDIQAAKQQAGFTALVTPQVRERVTVGPPSAWIAKREVDESFRDPGGNSILLIDNQHLAAGNEHYHRSVRRLETMQAVNEQAQWKLDFDPRTQQVVIHSLAVVRDGTRVDYAQAERLRMLQREGELENLVISGNITVVVLLEDVRVGDLIDASYTVRTTRRFLAKRMWFFVTIPPWIAVRDFRASIRFPAGDPMRWKSNDEKFAPQIHEADGMIEWSWRREKTQSLTPEARTPPGHIPGTWLQVSNCESWAEVAAATTAAWKEEANDATLQKLAAEITAACATPAERAARAIAMVQDDIRYLSVNEDLGGQIPSPPAMVLQRRYGDCKDKSFLLAHLLRLLGIAASPVLVNTFWRDTLGQFLPAGSLFNHAILQYQLEGRQHWADSTIPLQGGGAVRLVPDYKLGLPLRAGVAGLEPIAQPAERNDRYILNEEFVLDSRPGQDCTLQVTLRASGWNAEDLRRRFAQAGQRQVEQEREKFYKRFFPNIHRMQPLQYHDDRDANEFTIAELYQFSDVLLPAPNRRRCIFRYGSHLAQSVLALPDTAKRRQPMTFMHPCNVEHRIEMIIPESMGQIMPKTIRKTPEYHFSRECRKSFNRFAVTYAVYTLADRIIPERFEQHRKTVSDLWPETNFQLQFPVGLPAPPRKQPLDGNLLPAFPRKSASPFQPRGMFKTPPKSPQFNKQEPAHGEEGPLPPRRRRKAKPVRVVDPGLKRKRLIIGLVIAGLVIVWAVLAWLLFRA
ncbi:MAG TPA: DUF3857 domain-containing protein [Chthoniobacteraceae bacterium]|nr:DUF3857 domain-containing protein [Chthoniobacteraceae bacterium]